MRRHPFGLVTSVIGLAMAVCTGAGTADAVTAAAHRAVAILQTAGAGRRPSRCISISNVGIPGVATSRRAQLPQEQPPRAQSREQTETVTVTGTGRAGKPDNGGSVWLFNADDSSKFDNVAQSRHFFHDGVTRFSVPAGHYWALGDFIHHLPRQATEDEYLDVLPQFSVTKATTVHVSARAATSEIQAVTTRRTTEVYSMFYLVRSPVKGPAISMTWMEDRGAPKSTAPTLFISPTKASPTVGKLVTVTEEQVESSALPEDSRFRYDLAYLSSGTIPAQRHVIDQARVTTLHLRYYSAKDSAGQAGTFPVVPLSRIVCAPPIAAIAPARFPDQQTTYLSGSPSLAWATLDILNKRQDFSGGQDVEPQVYLPGQRVTEELGVYPLHPAPDYRLDATPGLPPVQASATRAGDMLQLALTAFSDSVPGHTGQGIFPPVKTGGSYQIEQDGKKVTGGSLAYFGGAFTAAARLSPSPSVIKFALSTSASAVIGPLATRSQTVWTWRSAHESGGRLPDGWTCLPNGQVGTACAVEPMMTLRYSILGEGLDGSASPGLQVARIWAGHLQLAKAAKITSAAMSVSFDGGTTWHPARITGRGGSYAAVFSAPAGARVTLRTSATDAAGGSVTETIINAYQTGS